jgi:phenylacetate-CoA oxygenase PaaH subunit
MSDKSNQWPLWEVFLRSKQGLDHRHCGSLHAPDAAMALQMARDVYTRRMEGVSIWVVPSAAITAARRAHCSRWPAPPTASTRTSWRCCASSSNT